jgi:hypothetical protein
LLRKLFFEPFSWIKSKKQKKIRESSNQFGIVACAVSNPENWSLRLIGICFFTDDSIPSISNGTRSNI